MRVAVIRSTRARASGRLVWPRKPVMPHMMAVLARPTEGGRRRSLPAFCQVEHRERSPRHEPASNAAPARVAGLFAQRSIRDDEVSGPALAQVTLEAPVVLADHDRAIQVEGQGKLLK